VTGYCFLCERLTECARTPPGGLGVLCCAECCLLTLDGFGNSQWREILGENFRLGGQLGDVWQRVGLRVLHVAAQIVGTSEMDLLGIPYWASVAGELRSRWLRAVKGDDR
jgi:hypothetical protein